MNSHNILVWNVRGLSRRARRSSVVREFVLQEHVCVLCLLETKLGVLSQAWATELMGSNFDYCVVSSEGASESIIVAWRPDRWTSSRSSSRLSSASVSLSPASWSDESWWITAVYGPVDGASKPAFP